jgi:23S rRNA (cytidine1920-2'-O)/16S rRNA (cytidine1409-2'-O)-methyltransferase
MEASGKTTTRRSKLKVRADQLLLRLGLAPSRERARALILAGRVYSGQRRVEKAGELLTPEAEVAVRGQDHPYVSRGGVKLKGALDAFGIDPHDAVAADIGASTGGFTDCLLQHGVRRVYAIDVGYGQLAEKLRRDPRVVVMEKTNARYLKRGELDELIDLVVIDASFIGLDKLLQPAASLLREGGQALALIKPQFEVGREKVEKHGVVRDEQARMKAIEKVKKEAENAAFTVLGGVDAAIKGPRGNQEHFIWLKKTGDLAVGLSEP